MTTVALTAVWRQRWHSCSWSPFAPAVDFEYLQQRQHRWPRRADVSADHVRRAHAAHRQVVRPLERRSASTTLVQWFVTITARVHSLRSSVAIRSLT